MDVETLREHVGPGPSDDVLERLLNAALQTITARYGEPAEEISEHLHPVGSLVYLSHRTAAVTAVREGTVLLDYSEYELAGGGKRLRRLDEDAEHTDWRESIEVTYVPDADDAERDRVAIALVNLDLNYQPGMTGSTVGPWLEQYANNSAQNYKLEREIILNTMRQPTTGVW